MLFSARNIPHKCIQVKPSPFTSETTKMSQAEVLPVVAPLRELLPVVWTQALESRHVPLTKFDSLLQLH
jgi:hypothetical protein